MTLDLSQAPRQYNYPGQKVKMRRSTETYKVIAVDQYSGEVSVTKFTPKTLKNPKILTVASADIYLV